MSSKLITDNPWRAITAAAKHSAGRVAVAYFGKGAARLLPMKAGSVLVVDASERAVKSGQTCPPDLLTLIKKGVNVFSVENLHAKVFSFRGVAFVGSTNVSGTSAHTLLEAVLRTAEKGTVGDIREFVNEIAKEPVSAEHAKRLARIYKPPKFGGSKGRKRAERHIRPSHVPLIVVNLVEEIWTAAEAKAANVARPAAKRLVQRGNELDELTWSGARPFAMGDQILQVIGTSSGSIMIAPPGRVIQIVPVRGERGQCVAFVDLPKKNRRSLKTIRSVAGRKAARRTGRNGALAPGLARAFRDVFYG